ncbi:MAG: hypothetical protein [Caudoviricetes sp.]|nr:MAG: hypothetical protein [Caudoviricetes sp.]
MKKNISIYYLGSGLFTNMPVINSPNTYELEMLKNVPYPKNWKEIFRKVFYDSIYLGSNKDCHAYNLEDFLHYIEQIYNENLNIISKNTNSMNPRIEYMYVFEDQITNYLFRIIIAPAPSLINFLTYSL